MSGQQPRFVPLSHIRLREDLWPRAGYAEEQLSEWGCIYAENGAQWIWPPVLLREVPGTAIFDIEDGANRVELARRLRLDTVPALVGPPIEDRDLRYAMVQHSSITSKLLTAEEKLAAVHRLKGDGWNHSDIARALGITRQTVHAWLKKQARAPEAGRGNGREESPERRHCLACLRSLKALHGEIEPDQAGSTTIEMAVALSCGAQELFGDEAGTWLRWLESCFGAAACDFEG